MLSDEERALELMSTLADCDDGPLPRQRRYRSILAAFAAVRAEGEAEGLRKGRIEATGPGPLFVDATPDGGYALRLLKAYRHADGVGFWQADLPSILVNWLNQVNGERVKELDIAIERLAKGE